MPILAGAHGTASTRINWHDCSGWNEASLRRCMSPCGSSWLAQNSFCGSFSKTCLVILCIPSLSPSHFSNFLFVSAALRRCSPCWTQIQTFAPQPCPGNQLRLPEDSCLQCATRAYRWSSPERALEPSEVKSSPEQAGP